MISNADNRLDFQLVFPYPVPILLTALIIKGTSNHGEKTTTSHTSHASGGVQADWVEMHYCLNVPGSLILENGTEQARFWWPTGVSFSRDNAVVQVV